MIFSLRYLLTALFLSIMLHDDARAVEWHLLNGTPRYSVSYDKESIRLTPLGRLEVWLRFVPRNETERKAAAAEYKNKLYRSHLEYYEIDCSDRTAQLGLIDLLGASRARLRRIQGGQHTEPIEPGSVLDSLAEEICPVMDEEALVNEDELDDAPENAITVEPLSAEKQLAIERLKRITEANKTSAAFWKELGNAYFDANQPENAINAYQQALAIKPDDADILNDQGAMYRQLGDYQHALANFEKAFLLDPHNLESLYNSAYIYAFDLHDLPKAQPLWQRYLTLDNDSATARQIRSYLEQTGNNALSVQEK